MKLHLSCVEERDFEKTHEVISEILETIHNDFNARFETVTVELFGQTKKVTVNHLLLSLCVIQLRYVFPEEYELSLEDFLPDNIPFNKVSSIIEYYFNESNDFIHDNELTDIIEDFYEVNAMVLTTIADVAWSINLYKGNTIDIYDMVKLCHTHKEVKDICFYQTKMDDNIQFADIESAADKQTKKLIELLRSDKLNSCYKNILGSVSPKQFQQVFVNISLKPDLYGIIIPEPINTNFFVGLRNVQDYFIDAVGARKALITNALQVSSAGYLSRKLSLLCINTTLSKVKDCKTDNLLEITINDEQTFNRYIGRYYRLSNSKSRKLSLIEEGDYDTLVGRKILLRSPATCGVKGNSVCHTCYGKLASRSRFHIGMVSVCLLTEQFIQMLLSSKHLLQVSTQRIELPDDIAKYFVIDRNCLVAKTNIDMIIGEFVSNDDYGYTTIPSISVKSETEEDYTEIQFEDITIFDDYVKEIVDDEKMCSLKEGEEAFNFNVENNEISAPLKKLLHILENEEELNKHTTIESLLNDFIRLLNESGIKSTATGVEMIIRELVRNPENVQERGTKDNFKFLRVTNAIINSNSLAVSLAFERLKSLLETNAFTKTESSIIDGLF